MGSITGFLNDLRALKSLKESFVRIKIYIDFWCEWYSAILLSTFDFGAFCTINLRTL
jgi:hypothetical protein